MGVYGAWLRRCVRTYGDEDEDEDEAAAAAAAAVLQLLVVGIIIILTEQEQEIELEGGLIRIRPLRPPGGDALPEEEEQRKGDSRRKEDITPRERETW